MSLHQLSAHRANGAGDTQACDILAEVEDLPDIGYRHEAGYLKQSRRGTRSTGLVLTLLLHAFVFALFLVGWGVSYVVEEREILNVFDIAPPAAPPEPPSEIPPGPEQVEKEKPQTEPTPPMIEPPRSLIPSENPVRLPEPVEPVPDPGPPVDKTTAPESKPVPPAPRSSNAKPTWEGKVLAALNRVKRYPSAAQRRREQGVPWVRFVMDREGRVLSVSLERSSGFPALDAEALKLPKRAQPLPKPPPEVTGRTIELVVPVEYFMR